MFSFTGLTKALQPESGADKEEPSPAPTTTSGAADGEQAGASSAGSGFWGFAAALSANIKQQTAEVAESFQRTSWVSELSNLADGLEKERVVLAERAHHVTDRLGHAMPEQASRVTKVAAQQLSSTLTALRAEVAHGGAEIADGVGALLGKPATARARSPSPASRRDAAAPPPLVQALLAEPDGAQDFEAWARAHADFPADRISAAREADSALAFAYTMLVPAKMSSETFWQRYFWRQEVHEMRRSAVAELAQRHREEEGVGWDSPDEAEEEAAPGDVEETEPRTAGDPQGERVAVGKGAASVVPEAASKAPEETPVSDPAPKTEAPEPPIADAVPQTAQPTPAERPTQSWSVVSEAVSGTSSPSSVEPATALAREEGPHDAQGDEGVKKEEEDEDDWGDDWE